MRNGGNLFIYCLKRHIPATWEAEGGKITSIPEI